MIFRKVADVKRELELAKKDEPPLELDHPVRKLISRFRKDSKVSDTTHGNPSHSHSSHSHSNSNKIHAAHYDVENGISTIPGT